MTLCHSRDQYVEFVWDQSSATWLGCHRRAFEWFDGVPERVIIDNAKCAIVKACSHDPLVQRAYAECAEGYGFKIDACPPHDPQKKGVVEKSAWTGRSVATTRPAKRSTRSTRWTTDRGGVCLVVLGAAGKHATPPQERRAGRGAAVGHR